MRNMKKSIDDFMKNSKELRDFVSVLFETSDSGELDDIETNIISEMTCGYLSTEHFTEDAEPIDKIGDFWDKLCNLIMCFPVIGEENAESKTITNQKIEIR